MKIHHVEQNTLEWLTLRVGKPTASEFNNIMTSAFALREGEGTKTYLAKKLAEAWRGKPLPGFTAWSCEQGAIREEEAIPWYELEHGVTLDRVGFIESDDERCGCSPDGLIGEDGGCEIKCPEAHTHVRYLLAGKIPSEYIPQVHGSLYVTGRKWWRFLSYRRGFPPLILTVQRDEAIMAKIADALAHFYGKFDAALATLKAAA